jgi:type I restriction enzyme M protein
MERKDFRWDYVDPGSEGGDLAWAQLVLGAMNESGIGAMLTSHGLLFRSGKSETFRQRLIGRGHLEAVITLPAGMLYGTSIPSAILVFNKAQKPEVLNAGVLLADVLLTKPFSKSHGEKKFPIDLPSAIASLVLANRNGLKINEGKYKDFELRCIKIKSQVLAENEFNLLPIRYFKSSMQDQNMGEIRKKIAEVESRIEELNKQLAKRRSPGSDERLMR